MNNRSIYYNRMTFKLITLQTIPSVNSLKSQNYLPILSKADYDTKCKLIFNMSSDLKTRMDLAKYFI